MSEPATWRVPLVVLIPLAVIVVISRYSGRNLLAEHYPGDRHFPWPSKWLGHGVFARTAGVPGAY